MSSRGVCTPDEPKRVEMGDRERGEGSKKRSVWTEE